MNGRGTLGIRRPAIAKQDQAHTDTNGGGSKRPHTNTTREGSGRSHTNTTRGGCERSHTITTKRMERRIYPSGTTVYEDDTMLYPYPKYRDYPNAEAHVYAFFQTWEANHVSQRLIEPEAERSKIAEFAMTLEGLAARWHAKHLPGSCQD